MALVRKCDICGKIYDDDKNNPDDPNYISKCLTMRRNNYDC